PEREFDDLWNVVDKPVEKPAEPRKIPPEPERDLLKFLRDYAPDLADWQRDAINIVREEMLYFLPQMRTKIMNEGWACATGESLLATESGFVRFDHIYDSRDAIRVASGAPGDLHAIQDYHKEKGVPTIRITTRRGYTIEGAL